MFLHPRDIEKQSEERMEEVLNATGDDLMVILASTNSKTVEEALNYIETRANLALEESNIVISKIEGKLAHHRKTDAHSRFKFCRPTMSVEDALELINKSNQSCVICGARVKFLHWAPLDKNQFSFDRLNDNDTHHRANCQLTCLGCNIKKAEQQYGIINTACMAEYKRYQKIFFKGEKSTAVRLHLAFLHDQIFSYRKRNNWLRAGEVAVRLTPQDDPERYFY